MFLALPYYSHSFAKTFHSYFLYTTQGYAKDDELRESVYRNDTEGCYIAGITQHKKKQFSSPTFTGSLSISNNQVSNNETVLTDLVHSTFL